MGPLAVDDTIGVEQGEVNLDKIYKLCNNSAHYDSDLSPSLTKHQLTFSSRDIDGNMPHVMARISAHTRDVMSVLPSGMALSHNMNPAASL